MYYALFDSMCIVVCQKDASFMCPCAVSMDLYVVGQMIDGYYRVKLIESLVFWTIWFAITDAGHLDGDER